VTKTVSLDNLKAFLRAIPHGYATIMFSDSIWVGLAMLCLTLFSPIVGLAGLFGLLIGLLSSRILGFEGWDSSSGVLSFNSLLIALTIGYYYPYHHGIPEPLHFVGLLVIAAFSTQILYIGISYLTQQWFRMPSMSLAFSIAGMFFWYYMVRSGYFTGYGYQKPLLVALSGKLGWFWQDYFVSMGSIVFVPDLWIGIAMTVLLFFISRIALFLSLIGWSICYFLLHFSSMTATYGMFFPGFNLILISLAIGSVYLIPGKSSYFLAAIGTVVGFLLAYALSGKYYYPDIMPNRPDVLFVPMFAFPMNIVVISTIFALRLRLRQHSPIINDYGILHPEKALDAYLSRYRRFTSAGVPQIHLPVTGEWVITQGHSGEHTHRKDWAFAWDFEIEDIHGKKYTENELELKDYYCFGKPVHASAAGQVVKVVTSIPDNTIGVINTKDNWGNYVSISHGYGYYTLYAHLKEGSIKLREGDVVKQGDKLGQVGNSGRSPFPHLHFHAQMGVDAGSKTIFSHLINYKQARPDGSYEFVSSGIPETGDRISPLVPEHDLAPLLQFGYGQKQSYQVQTRTGEYQENWEVTLDLLGTHSLVSDRGTKLDFSIYNGIYNSLNLHGRRLSALSAFAIGASRLPWVENQDLEWRDEPSLSVVMNPIWKNTTLFFIPFFRPIKAETVSRLKTVNKALNVTSETNFYLLGMKIGKNQASLILTREDGITEISLSRNDQQYLKATRIEATNEDTV